MNFVSHSDDLISKPAGKRSHTFAFHIFKRKAKKNKKDEMHLTKTGYLASANNNRIKKMFQKMLIVCIARKAVVQNVWKQL